MDAAAIGHSGHGNDQRALVTSMFSMLTGVTSASIDKDSIDRLDRHGQVLALSIQGALAGDILHLAPASP